MLPAAPSAAQLLIQGATLQPGAGQGARALEMAFLLWGRLVKENSLDVFGRIKGGRLLLSEAELLCCLGMTF